MHKNTTYLISAIGLGALIIAGRLIPHPWNFTPVGAVILFSGFILPRTLAVVPLGALALSDLFLGSYTREIMLSVYGSYALMYAAAQALRSQYSFSVSLISSSASAVLFFLVTNAAVWVWSGMYAPGLDGLFSSYIAGIPFFRNTLLSYAFYSTALYSAHMVARTAHAHLVQKQKTPIV